jgi:uncharacterized MAPEG superfamily protein
MNGLAIEMGIDLDAAAGPIWVTLCYLGLYYAFMQNIAQTKMRLYREYRERGERFDRYHGKDPEMLAADRVQLNTLEHMPVFLAALWLHAFFVSPETATYAGSAYVALRLLYPFVLGKRLGTGLPLRVLLVTFPSYGVLGYLLVTVGLGAL